MRPARRLLEFQLNPWDTSAGYLLAEEAGGKITHFDGSKFTLDSREVLATNGLIHAEMMELFAEMFAGRDYRRYDAGGICGPEGGRRANQAG